MHILQMVVAIHSLKRLVYNTEETPCSQQPEVLRAKKLSRMELLFKRSPRFQISSNQICEDCLGEAYTAALFQVCHLHEI